MKTTQWDQQGRSGDFIVNLTKKYTFLRWISEFQMRFYFLKACFLNKQLKNSSKGTALNFHGTRHWVTPDIWPTELKILLKNLPLFD